MFARLPGVSFSRFFRLLAWLGLLVGGGAAFTAGPLHAQSFEARSFDLTGVYWGASAWGDYDGDGDLDLVVTGNSSGDTPTAKLYRNLGASAFVEVAAGLTGVTNSSSSWGDYDGDGDLDLVVTGSDGSERTATIYRNDGGGAFIDITAGLTGVTSSSSSWGDYDGDGDLDLVITGFEEGGRTATIYRNDADGTFTDIGAGLVGVSNGSSSWGDYDGDGDLDLVITGHTSGRVETATLYRNDGGGTFTDVPAGLTTVYASSSSWGDYDGDGDLDLVVSGGWDSNDPGDSATIIYRNDGGGVFTDIDADLPPGVSGSASWGDYDNDGDLDLLVTGFDEGGGTAALYRNDGGDTFTDVAANLTGVGYSSSSWGDYDGDGGLDLIITGDNNGCCGNGGHAATIYENTGTNANTAPDAPTALTHTVVNAESGTVELSWAAAADNPSVPGGETAPQDALTYNVRVGTAPGAGDVVAPHAITAGYNPGGAANGTRLLPARGNAEHRTSLTITGLEQEQTYYWSVQTVDPGLAGSSFAGEDAIAFPLVFRTEQAADLTGVDYRSSTAWGDYDGDGDLDLLVTGLSSEGETATVYRNDGNGTFTDIGVGLTGVGYSSSAWGDYDGDGDLDLVIAGWDDVSNPTAAIYRNDGDDTFTDIGAGLTGVGPSSLAWGDYDGDGDLDLVVTGSDGSERTATIYRNDGGSAFTDIEAGLTGVELGSSSWGDYDGDGDLDLVVTGSDGITFIAKIYRNDGSGTFTDVDAGLTGVILSSSAWGDYDGDGDLDLLVTGGDVGGDQTATVYRNDGGDTFTDAAAGLTGVVNGSLAWGDYDGDGNLDLVVTGASSEGETARVYHNDGSGVLTDIEAGLTGVGGGSSAWGDYDGDGSLDLVITGSDAGGNRTATIYENTGPNTNAAPEAPSGLSATVVDAGSGTVELSWAAAADNPSVPGGETAPEAGLTYNVRLGTAPGTGDVVAPHAITAGYNPGGAANGTRLVPARGNAEHRTSLTVTGLEVGQTYYWSVQTVDPGLAGSSFAAEATIADDALPVELVAFDAVAREGIVTLRWQTASETGNTGFVVETRSDSTAAWIELGFVEGAGTTREAQSYRFETEDLAPGAHVFRLRQLDLDGSAHATAPITARVGLEGRYRLQAYPNPVARQATVEVAVRTDQTVTVDVYDAVGRRVATLYDGMLPASEAKRIALDAERHRLRSGLYFVRLVGEGFVANEHLVVVR